MNVHQTSSRPHLGPRACHRAVDARDPRFDGVFFVGITTTRIYCRPICPSRPADPGNRRFFGTAAAAEREGFRPCLRCRPELAPGRARVDAVSRLASTAARRIAAGALNGRPVGSLASDLCVSERHLRRALERELGVSPVQLAQTHRLLLAKRLLVDTELDMSRVAFGSGFQSLRRFNAAFRDRYRMTPTELRERAAGRAGRTRAAPRDATGGHGAGRAEDAPGDLVEGRGEPIELALTYRPPFAWDRLLASLARSAIPGVEVVEGSRYGRTVRVDEARGTVVAEDRPDERELRITVSRSLVPALMPLLSRLRRVFDLDAEPSVIDAHLEEGGLASLVQATPGLRVPGPFDGFEAALLAVIGAELGIDRVPKLAGRVARTLGEPLESRLPSLDRVAPIAERVAGAGTEALVAGGVPEACAAVIVDLAAAVADGSIRLDPDGDPGETRRALFGIPGIDESRARAIVTRAVFWPDAFPAEDPALQRAAGAADASDLLERAEGWRPWRAYAASHLRPP